MTEPSKKTLLVVDDDQDIRQLLCDALSQKGYQVREAEDGRQMWAHLEAEAVDLVLMDLYLKEEDGLSLAREIRERFVMPIMMLTGKGDEPDRILGLELAADDYMMKPFNLRELTARIHALLRRSFQAPPADVHAVNQAREQLIEQSRGLETEVFDRTVDVLILRLRRKIESNPKTPEFIKTQRGLGYFFQGPVRAS